MSNECYVAGFSSSLNLATLDGLFNPKTLAFIATEDSLTAVSQHTIRALEGGGFRGTISVVGKQVLSPSDRPTYASLSDVPGALDLVIGVATPETAPELVADCAAKDVKGVILFSGGFGVSGMDHEHATRLMRDILKDRRTRVIGPNALGVMNPRLGFNATPGLQMPIGGPVAYIGQSPTLARFVLDWSLQRIVGFSSFACLGTMLDVDWANLIDHFGQDPYTRTIILQINSIGNARSFISAVREVSLDKPIIAIKTGRHEVSVRASAWKSDCAVGDDDVLTAAFHRCGVLQVESLEDLFYTADALSKQPRPSGPKLMLVSNAVGAGVLAADSIVRSGGTLTEPSPETRAHLSEILPSDGLIDDIIGDRSAESYALAVDAVAKDPSCDGVLALLVPSALSNPEQTAELLIARENTEKPLLMSHLGSDGSSVRENFSRACIPTFSSPATAARIFNYMWRYSNDLQALYQTPARHVDVKDMERRAAVRDVIAKVKQDNRESLSDDEAKTILGVYGIGVSAQDAGIESVHPFQSKLGSRYDQQFGSVLMFGSADRGRNVYGDLVVGLPPLNATLARLMLERSAFYTTLKCECPSTSVLALEALLVRLSQLVTEEPRIRQIEISPIVTGHDGLRVLGCSFKLHHPGIGDSEIREPAIRPYPARYIAYWTMKNGQTVTVRPICAEDEPLMIEFHKELSDQSVYMRYFQHMKFKTRTAHDRLVRVCFLDYDREFALLAERSDPETNANKVIAIATLQKIPWKSEAEVAVLISDQHHGQGLGRELIARLMLVARDEGLKRLTATTMVENEGMCAIFKKLGFRLSKDFEENLVYAELTL